MVKRGWELGAPLWEQLNQRPFQRNKALSKGDEANEMDEQKVKPCAIDVIHPKATYMHVRTLMGVCVSGYINYI